MANKTLSVPFKIKSVTDEGTFSGYGSVFGVVDSYGDVVEKGAFKASLEVWEEKGKLPVMLWQHRHDEPIGVYEKMYEDEHGLFVEGRLLVEDDPLAKRAHAHMKAGSISGLSIGYSVPKGGGEWDETEDVYRLKQIKLWEVSPVTFPANEEAQIDTVKSAIQNERSFERFLREAGLSRTQAKGLMAKGFSGLNQREAEDVEILESLKQLNSQLAG